MRHHPHRIFLTLGVAIVCALAWGLPQMDKDLSRGYSSIQPQEAYGYVKTMALPKYAGRFTGHEGYTAAARWAAARFKDWGLKPLSREQGYLQAYPSPYVIVDKAAMTLLEVDTQ